MRFILSRKMGRAHDDSLARTEQVSEFGSTARSVAKRCQPGTPAGPAWASSTAGIANGFVRQSRDPAGKTSAVVSFASCQLNPNPCTDHRMSDVGNPRIPSLGIDLDIRTTCPATGCGATARWWRNRPTSWRAGRRPGRVRDRLLVSRSRRHCWQTISRSVTSSAGVRCDVPYQHPCASSAPFAGPDGVSMRPLNPRMRSARCKDHLALSVRACAPVHLGHPHSIRHRR